MFALVGLVIGTLATVAVGWTTIGRGQVLTRDPTFDPEALGGRYVTILGGLAGFAVTGMVFLVTLGRSLPGADSPSFTTVVAMFLVAYVGFLGASILFANIHAADTVATFDVPAAMFAGGTVMVWFTIGIAWFALVPLFDIVGLHRLADLAGWLLFTSTLISYSGIAVQLDRTGLVSGRLTLIIPAVAAGVVAAYALVLAAVAIRPADSTLALAIGGLILGLPAYAAIASLPALVRHDRVAQVVATAAPFGVYALAQGAAVLIGLLVFTILVID